MDSTFFMRGVAQPVVSDAAGGGASRLSDPRSLSADGHRIVKSLFHKSLSPRMGALVPWMIKPQPRPAARAGHSRPPGLGLKKRQQETHPDRLRVGGRSSILTRISTDVA